MPAGRTAAVMLLLLVAAAFVKPLGVGAAEKPQPPPPLLGNVYEQVIRGDAEAAVRAYNAWCLPWWERRRRAPPELLAPEAREFLRQALGYNPAEIASPLLEPRDTAYLQRTIFLRQVALAVVGDTQSEGEKADRLFRFVTLEILPYADRQQFAWPTAVLRRGYGSCDQASWVLCWLAEQVGLKGMVLFLREPRTGTSPHTIAALKIEGQWRPYDPFAALDYKGGADRAPGLLRALAEPSRLAAAIPRGPGQCLLVPENLLWADFLVPAHPRGMLPRWNQFISRAGRRRLGLWLYHDPFGRIREFRRELAKALGGSATALESTVKRLSTILVEKNGGKPLSVINVSIHGDPLNLYRKYSSPKWIKQQNSLPWGRFRRARELHLTGKHVEALAALELIPGDAIPAEAHGARAYYRALTLLAAGNPARAVVELVKLRKSFPESIWAAATRWPQAICLIKLGQEKEAAAQLGQVPEPRRAAAWLRAKSLPHASQ